MWQQSEAMASRLARDAVQADALASLAAAEKAGAGTSVVWRAQFAAAFCTGSQRNHAAARAKALAAAREAPERAGPWMLLALLFSATAECVWGFLRGSGSC